VLTRDDILARPRHRAFYGPVFKDQTIVANGKSAPCRRSGSGGGGVDDRRAEAALKLIEVDYEELPAVLNIDEAPPNRVHDRA